MENTYNHLSQEQTIFFQQLKSYLNVPIYFYGSVQRSDYIPNYSDIDIDIFSDTVSSTVMTLCNFLQIPREEVRPFVYHLDKIVHGYKTKYASEDGTIQLEISVYNARDKERILAEHAKNMQLSWIVLTMLYILKWLYYRVGILPNTVYATWKRWLMNERGRLKFIQL